MSATAIATPASIARTRATRTVPPAMFLLSAAAAVVHFMVVPEHLEEWAPFGVFFLALGLFETVWALAVVARAPSRSLLVLGLVANAATIALWAFSRTAGLPIGPEHWTAEAVAVKDVLCGIFELAVVAGCAGLLVSRRRG